MASIPNPFEPTPTPTPTTEPDLKSLRVYSNDDPSGSTVYKVAGEGGSSRFDLSDRMKKGSAAGAVIEGYISGNNASGNHSHAEGKLTTASGNNAHSEGMMTNATGSASHAEGSNAAALGANSHAEGESTTASGIDSHAEGYGTKAAGRSEHVFGEYNVASNPANANTGSDYVEIVGNGTADNARSNARTLDWSGNESLAGSITLGMGTANEVTLTAGDLRALLGLLSNS